MDESHHFSGHFTSRYGNVGQDPYHILFQDVSSLFIDVIIDVKY